MSINWIEGETIPFITTDSSITTKWNQPSGPDHLYSIKFKDRRRMVGGSNSLSLCSLCDTMYDGCMLWNSLLLTTWQRNQIDFLSLATRYLPPTSPHRSCNTTDPHVCHTRDSWRCFLTFAPYFTPCEWGGRLWNSLLLTTWQSIR